jgi:hypothetical protein
MRMQLLLVVALLLVIPHNTGRGFHRSLTPDTFSRAAEQKKDTIPPGQGKEAYCIVFDAGSTGQTLDDLNP